MTKEEFLSNVTKEVKHIKANATKEELVKLNYNNFNFKNIAFCIYGLLTGNCESDRAKELCVKSFRFGFREDNFEEMLKTEKGNVFTNLEIYLYYSNENTHKNIIDYLKGNVKTLNKLEIK